MGDQVRSVRVRLSAENASYIASMKASGAVTKQTAREMDGLSASSRRADSDLDRVSGRAKILVQSLAVLGPALVPISSLAIPALSGLANTAGFAATGLGTIVLASQGVGDALKALNKAHLEPTTDNLNAARLAVDRLSPSAQRLVKQIQELRPKGAALVDTAAEGFFPGLSEGIDSLETLYPRAKKIIGAISGELGDIAAETGESLASDRWAPFLDFVGEQAPHNLDVMADSIGNVVHGLAGLWMGTEPLNDDFNDWLVSSTENFDDWANTLDSNQGYQDLISYIRENGPQAGETLGALANALIQVVQAASPLGGPVLSSIEAVADAISSIADSDLGTPIFTGIAALALLNRALAVTSSLQGRTIGGPAIKQMKSYSAGWKSVTTEVVSARVALARAQATQSAARQRTVDSMSALIPTQQKRRAIYDYNAVMRQTAEVEKRVAVAEKARTEGMKDRWKTVGKGVGVAAGLAVATTGVADGIGLTNTASLGLLGTIGGPLGVAFGTAVGFTMDLTHANDDLDDAMKRVMESARSGDFKALNKDVEELTGHLKNVETTSSFGDFFGDAKRWAGDVISNPSHFFKPDAQEDAIKNQIAMAKALAKSGQEARNNAAAQNLLADGFDITDAGARTATASMEDFAASLTSANNILNRRSSMRSYASALLDFADAIKENGTTLDQNTRKGIDNQEKLDAIATTALAAAEKMASGPKKARFLDSVRDQYIKARMALGATRKEAERLADRLGLLDQMTVNPNISLKTAAAYSQVNSLVGYINGLKATIDVKAAVNPQVGGLGSMLNPGKPTNLDGTRDRDGNPKTGKGKADGGSIFGPGTKTSDSVPIMASVGEFMQPASSVDYYGVAFMEAVRRRQLPRLATGGPIGDFPTLDLSNTHSASATSAANKAEQGRNRATLRELNKQLKEFQKELAKSTTAIDDELSTRMDLISQRTSMQSSIQDSLRADPFSTERPDNWEWMAAGDRKNYLLNNPLNVLTSNATKGDAFTKALQSLASKGVDGHAFDLLANSGDLEQVQAYAAQSKGFLSNYEAKVARSDSATLAAGRFGAGVVFNPQIDTSNAHLDALVKEAKGTRSDIHDVKVEIKKHGANGKASKSSAAASVRTRKKGT